MSQYADWYKDAVIYELRVRSFFDSDDDGIGDLRGLTEKLDYLKDLGVTALWLLPFYPSPLKDDGYDIADYFEVHPSLGGLDEFRQFLDAAHARDLKVITELVLNHTSDAHPWFQRARRSPAGSANRDYYVWSDDPQRWSDARIIFRDYEPSNWSWDPVAKAYYWHRFYSHQPDLNFASPEVREALAHVVDHWFGMGVDGMRLDAVPYLFEREGTDCENLPETHAYLKELRAHVDRKFPNRMLLAEANQWPEDAVAYFGDGDECHMAFHFPIMPRLFMALRMEDSYPITDVLEQTPAIPEQCQWATFLRNHDELTLEMVTDEERDYMVQRYAADRQTRINLGIRRRLAPLLLNDRRSIELLNALLFSMPGTPVIYYGDEIGMGDNAYLGDRNGVRTPMQWSPDRNGGFSRSNPQRLILPVITDPEYRYETVNVEVQQANPRSLLWWMKSAIALRKRYPAFARGSLRMLALDNRKVLAFLREYGEETLLVVANLSRAPQWVELELTEFKEVRPVELFGNVEFPEIGERPYLLTLGGHDVLWFTLGRAAPGLLSSRSSAHSWDALVVAWEGEWHTLLRPGSPLESTLARYVPRRRWFRSKSRRVREARLLDAVTLDETGDIRLVVVEIHFDEGDSELYALPLGVERAEKAPASALLGVTRPGGAAVDAWILDASSDGRVGRALHALALAGRRVRGSDVDVYGSRVSSPPALDSGVPSARALGGEQTNTSYLIGQHSVGKLMRRLEEGRSLELEILEHLERAPLRPNVPRLLAEAEIDVGNTPRATLWMSQSYVANEGDAWQVTVDAMQRFYERVLTSHRDHNPERSPVGLIDASIEQPPQLVEELLGEHLRLVELLGKRTAELHSALAHDPEHPKFAPQRHTDLGQRSFYQSLRNLAARAFDRLAKAKLAPTATALAAALLERRRDVRARIDPIRDVRPSGRVIRVHGDYHLGQVLYTGRDLFIIDFEGEPGRTRAERERLRSPTADLASMLRSFHYAALGVLTGELRGSRVRDEDRATLEPWGEFHYYWSAVAFLRSYFVEMGTSVLLPTTKDELALLLDVHLIEKAMSELAYELDTRPNWVELPLRGLLGILGSRS
jgi:maltose alpha-D-glucosyltransferase/alpha-amylase